MRYAIIKDGVIDNVVIADPEFAESRGWIECPDGVGIGWQYDGQSEALPPARDIDAEWAVVRAERNRLLQESDVEVLPDRWMIMEEETKLLWATYREALRDIPETFDDPADVVWPQKPQ